MRIGLNKKIVQYAFRVILYIIFGLLPSLVWLGYYLKKDQHPEPKKTILKIFLWGAVITIPVFLVQIGLMYLLAIANFNSFTASLIYWFLIISLSEEFFKYLIIRLKIKNSPDLDEPLDIMLYMTVAALGFAALENILYLFSPIDGQTVNEIIRQTMLLSFVRFIGATFLHTLCSAVVGYFMAISFYYHKKRLYFLFIGLVAAVLLHGLYDFSIMKLEGYQALAIPLMILLVLGFSTFLGFEKLKKMKSVSIIK